MASPATDAEHYAPVVTWNLPDRRRILPVPPGHWLLVQDTAPFRATLNAGDERPPQHVQSIAVRDGHVACFAPDQPAGDARLALERYAPDARGGADRFLAPGRTWIRRCKPLAISNLPALRNVTAHAVKRRCRDAGATARPAHQRHRRHGAAVRGSRRDQIEIRLPARREPASARAGGPPCFCQARARLGQCRWLHHAAGFAQSRLVRAGAARGLAFHRQRRRRPHGGNPAHRQHAARAATPPCSISTGPPPACRRRNRCRRIATCG